MGGVLGTLLGGPLKGIIDSIGGIIDNLHTSDAEKLAAKQKLIETERNFQLEVMRLDGEWAKTQADVIGKEITSESWMARNWRPILMLTFTYITAHNYVLAPLFSLKSVIIPTDMWELLKIGMGGYIVGRSAEKIAPSVVQALTTKDKQ